MERKDFECELAARIEDIMALYRKYDPEARIKGNEYLSICIINGKISANNRYFLIDCDKPVNFHIDENGYIHSL